jgi:hypothetical protein
LELVNQFIFHWSYSFPLSFFSFNNEKNGGASTQHTGARWPHLFNGLKYGLMMTVTLVGALHPLYETFQASFQGTVAFQLGILSLFALSTLYSTYWDICQV